MASFRPTPLRFYTVGHSSHSWEYFAGLLCKYGLEVLVDTRSAPYSRFAPQFDREALKAALQELGVRYLWLGNAIGGRPKDSRCYDDDGHVLYGRVAELAEFREAIERLERGADEFRIGLLCSEEDPAHCHRRLLVTRVLLARGAMVEHIRGDGSIDHEDDIVRKSGKALDEKQPGLFPEIEETQWRSTAAIGKRAARSIFE